MPDSPFVHLGHNAALLLALVLVYDLVVSRYPLASKPGRQLVVGVLLGGMGLGIMLAPFQLVPGIVFDTRSVLLAVSGLFFGFIPTLVAMLLTAAYRLSQGGAAAWVGVAVIFASGSLGLLGRRRHHQALAAIPWSRLYGLGLVVHVVMLLLMLPLGWPTARDVLASIGLPVLVIYPVATTALGLLLANQLRREQAAAAQRVSDERWQFALEGAGDGVWDWDVANRHLFFSTKWKRMLGYDEADIGHGLEEWSGRVHPEDLPAAMAEVQAHLDGRTCAYVSEHRVRCKDGSYKWILDRGLVVNRDAAGQPLRMVGTHADITARKQAEQAIAAAQAEISRFGLALDHLTSTCIYMKDRQGRYTYGNRTILELFACTAAELRGSDDTRFFPPPTATQLRAIDIGVMEQGLESAAEVIVPRSDGSVRYHWDVKTPIYDGPGQDRICGLCGISTDITERKQAEVALRTSEQRYRSLFENYHTMMLLIDPADGAIVDANPAAADFYGWPREELQRKKITDINRLPAEEVARRLAGARHQRRTHLQLPHTRADGSVRQVEVFSGPIELEGRSLLFSIVVDITDRLQAQQQVEEAQAEAAQLLADAGRSRQALLSLVEDLRHAEQRLKLEQELAQSTLDALKDHICVVDGTGNIIAVNRAWREFGAANGLPADTPWLGLDYLGICHTATGPESGQAAEFSIKLQTVLAGQADSLEMEYSCDSPEERRWFVARALRFVGQGAMRVVVTHENITARKQAEDDVRRLNAGLELRVQERTRELQEATQRLDMAQRDAGAGIWDWDLAADKLDWSPPLFALFGLDPQATDASFETWDSVLHPEDREEAHAQLQAAIRQHQRLLHEYRMVRPDGQVRWINVVGQASYDRNGQPLRMAGICIDITARKQTEEALQQTEERTRTVLQASSIGTFEVDLATGGGKWNSVEFELLGLHAGEVPETLESFFGHIHPDDAAPVRAQWEEALRTGEFESEFRIVRADGRECWLAGKGRFARDQADGRPVRFLGVNYDITARKHLESETTRLLERERQVSEMKTRFISVTSHEFRTPMTTIMGSVELLANHLDRLTPEKRAQIFERVNSSLQRMTTMLDDVLTLNRLDANRTEVLRTPIDLAPFLVNLVHEIRTGDHDAHRLELRLPAGPIPFVTDPNLLHHIVSNLLSNAVRYSPAGTTVTVSVTSDAWRIHLAVEDQGIGIPPADRERIFEPFERGSNVAHLKGNGLGLNIVKRLTDLLGGGITLHPLPGGGTRFTLALPHPSPAPAPSPSS